MKGGQTGGNTAESKIYYYNLLPAPLLLPPSNLGCLVLTRRCDQTHPRLCPGRYQLRSVGQGLRLKHVSLLPTFISSQLSSQAYPMPPHPCLLLSSPSSCLSLMQGRVARRDKPETPKKGRKQEGKDIEGWGWRGRKEARRKRETHIVLFKWMGNDSLGFADNYTVGFNQFGPFTAWRGLIPQYKGTDRGRAVPEKAPAWCK